MPLIWDFDEPTTGPPGCVKASRQAGRQAGRQADRLLMGMRNLKPCEISTLSLCAG